MMINIIVIMQIAVGDDLYRIDILPSPSTWFDRHHPLTFRSDEFHLEKGSNDGEKMKIFFFFRP